MNTATQDTLFFFDRHQAVYPLYECFQKKLLARLPESRIKVQKSQISYYNRHLYACISFLKVKRNQNYPRTILCLHLGFLLRWNQTGWRQKPSRIRDGGQRILLSAVRPI